jgi:hypothetical protein
VVDLNDDVVSCLSADRVASSSKVSPTMSTPGPCGGLLLLFSMCIIRLYKDLSLQ